MLSYPILRRPAITGLGGHTGRTTMQFDTDLRQFVVVDGAAARFMCACSDEPEKKHDRRAAVSARRSLVDVKRPLGHLFAPWLMLRLGSIPAV
jgi:hypothetical protein